MPQWSGFRLQVSTEAVRYGGRFKIRLFSRCLKVLLSAHVLVLLLFFIIFIIIIIIIIHFPYITAFQPVLKIAQVSLTKHLLFTVVPKTF